MKVQDLEVSQRKKLDRLRQKSPADRAQLTMAETELQKASVKASAMTKNLEQLIDKFEEEKLKDLKVVNIVHFISLVFFLTKVFWLIVNFLASWISIIVQDEKTMSGHFFLQKILTDFVNIEMVYHAKALEVYTECFQNIRSFDVEEDIEVFYIV